jgi:hypothetical protein
VDDIPEDVLERIRLYAKAEWPDNQDMCDHLIEEEIDAYSKLSAMPTDVPTELIDALKAEAADFAESYSLTWITLDAGIKKYRRIKEVREKVGPLKDLLLSMEQIIGAEAYNASIQNYGPGGEWYGEGRGFRYPVTFIDDREIKKTRYVSKEILPEVLITGHYVFGANDLNIYRGLLKVLEMLERDYGLQLPK